MYIIHKEKRDIEVHQEASKWSNRNKEKNKQRDTIGGTKVDEDDDER